MNSQQRLVYTLAGYYFQNIVFALPVFADPRHLIMASRSSPAYSPLPTRPLSPWAQRYQYNTGGRHPLIEDEEIHSGIAPELPRLHPKYYADAPSRDTLNPTKLQLDTLFLTEAFQRNYFRGLESWQNATFMRYVWFSNQSGILSGGHREADYGPVDGSMAVDPTNITGSLVNEKKEDIALKIFHSERIQVDETKWFTFLKKDRWYDTVKPVPVLGGANWSVDNPKVWEVLSISLELVDRILKALLADRHVMLVAIFKIPIKQHWLIKTRQDRSYTVRLDC